MPAFFLTSKKSFKSDLKFSNRISTKIFSIYHSSLFNLSLKSFKFITQNGGAIISYSAIQDWAH